MKIKMWNECVIDITPADPRLKIPLKRTGFVKGFNEGHGLDFSLSFKQKPRSNIIHFKMKLKNVIPYHQPPMTKEWFMGEQLPNGVTVTAVNDTDVIGSNGKRIAHRPEHVVNSIAFYHSTKGGQVSVQDAEKGITTGKLGHLYRMKVIDAKGNESWTDWDFNKSDLQLKIPQPFIESAIYPIAVKPIGDVFGYTTAGGSNTSGPGYSYMVACGDPYTPGCPGDGVSISVYADDAGTDGNIQMAIYTRVDDTNGTLVTNGSTPSVAVTSASGSWLTSKFATAPALTAVPYYVVRNTDTGNYYYDAGAAKETIYYVQAFGSWPASPGFSQWAGVSRKWSIFVIYNVRGLFGNTAQAYGNDGGANTIWGGLYTCSRAGIPTYISIGMTGGPGLGKVKFAVYKASDYSLVCYTGEWTVTAGYDFTKKLAVSTVVKNLEAGEDYYICVFMEKTDYFLTAGVNTGGRGVKIQNLAYGAFPDPATLVAYDTGYKLWAYVDYDIVGETLYENCLDNNSGTGLAGATWGGQSFTPSVSHTLTSVELSIYQQDALMAGNLDILVYLADANNKPTGAVIASGSRPFTSFPYSGYNVVKVTMNVTGNLTAGTKYVMVFKALDAGLTVYQQCNAPTGTYAGGKMLVSVDSGANWTELDYDAWFKEYGIATDTTIGTIPLGTWRR